MTLIQNTIQWYIKKRGVHSYDTTTTTYTSRRSGDEYEIEIEVREWETPRGWLYRRVRVGAFGEKRDHHLDHSFYRDVPLLPSGIGWRSDSGRTWIELPTRTDHIRWSVGAVTSMIEGHRATDPETERAVQEALQERGSE